MNNLYKKSVKLKNNNNNKTVLFCYLAIHELFVYLLSPFIIFHFLAQARTNIEGYV